MSRPSALQAALAQVVARRDLTAAEATAAVETLMRGEASEAQIGAFLAALAVKGETVAEVVGAARALRAHAERVVSHRAPLVDTCGTGGDGGRTFSISTAAALVAAGAGAAVAKHGNRAATGRFGGADVLEALGVAIDLPAEAVGRCLDEVGMAFLFARRLHPAMRHVAAARRDLGVRTIFNLLGPLANPAGATRQVIGVPSPGALELVAGALAELGSEHALVVHNRDGLDEIGLASPTDAIEVQDGVQRRLVLDAASFGVEPAALEALLADDLAAARSRVEGVLAGDPGPCADVVAVNAAAALYVAGRAASLRAGVLQARAAIASGAARAVLDRLIKFTRAVAETGDASAPRARV